ncbi:echinoderm microtubule-associated protein-like [Biomphalaria glabrata]
MILEKADVTMEPDKEDGNSRYLETRSTSNSWPKLDAGRRKKRSRSKLDILSRTSYLVDDTDVEAGDVNAGAGFLKGTETVITGESRFATNMQKTRKLFKRQVMTKHRLPPVPLTDDDDHSSLSDSTEQPKSYRTFLRDQRYEDPKHRDNSLGRGQLPLQIRQQNDLYEPQPQEENVGGLKGRRVMFFRNGDIHFKPKQVLINQKTYANLEKLLVDLSSMVETSTGVKHIFSWPEGREIKSIKDFENGKYYICSSTSKLQRVDYGNSKENHWKGGKIDRKENFLFQQDGKVQSPLRRPRILTIISNMYRDSREKLILNTNSQMNFEDILNDISNMVNIPNPPVRALYTERPPHQKVESYSQLIREFADHDNFLACGEEMLPFELMPKKPIAADSQGKSKKGVRRRNTKSELSRVSRDQSLSPTRESEDTAFNELVQDKVSSRFVAKTKRNKTDSIKVDINGKIREFFPPSVQQDDDDGRKPDKKIKLDWVYGFRGRDVKQNLAVLPSSGQLVYFVAAVVVLYDKKFSTQKHYLGHSEEITCLTIHPNGRFIATGQTAGKTPDKGAHVRVWDGTSLSTYAVIGLGIFQQGISCVNFSDKGTMNAGKSNASYGELLMAIDDSDRHQLSVWDWQTEKVLAKTTTSSDPVVSGCFYPNDETILITYGKEHIHFWKMFLDKGKKIMRDKLSGIFEDYVPKFVTSVCFSSSGNVITGDSTGAILVWSHDENNVFTINEELSQYTKKAHKKSVSSLCMLGDGTLLSGGGNEVKAWDSINDYAPVKERILPSTAGHVRSIVPINKGGLDGSIYVSTTRNKVLEGSLQLKFKFIIQGHVEELWAVESHPLEQTFISAGHDQTVVKWSAVAHTAVWKVNVENPCTCISIDPRGRIVALGTTAGKIIALNSLNGAMLTTLPCGAAQINALGFSPDGKLLGVGTFDGFIQIYHVQEEGHQFFKTHISSLKHNNIFIMHLDWSVDSKYIQAVLGDYEIVYWDVTTGQKIKSPRLVRDIKWATQNCPIGYPLIGAWQNLDRGDVINVVARSQYQDLMMIGDSKGQLRLYKWPSAPSKANFRHTKVFSSNVTCVTFTCDDNFVIASGGNDAALMQFSVLDPVNT